jgi:hypothetical protein
MNRCLFACLLFIFLCIMPSHGENSLLRSKPTGDGFITSWLILGPFSNSAPGNESMGEHGAGCYAFHNDLLKNYGGEANLLPETGQKFRSIENEEQAWQAYFSPSWWIDFNSILTPNEDVAAYAFVILDANEPIFAALGLGYNDGIKVWLNGQLLYEEHTAQVAANSVSLPVMLQKGANRLMVKIDEKSGGWGFGVSLTDQPAGSVDFCLPLPAAESELQKILFSSAALLNSEPLAGESLALTLPFKNIRLPYAVKLPLVVLDEKKVVAEQTITVDEIPKNVYPFEITLQPALYSLALKGMPEAGEKSIAFVDQKVFNKVNDAKIGERPYEMGDRAGCENPQIDFEDVSDWWVRSQHGGSARVFRTREQQMDGQYVAKTVYHGTSGRSSFEFGPKNPMPIPLGVDAVSIWIYGNNWGWVPDPTTPQVEVQIVIVDKNYNEQAISLGKVNWKGWFLRRGKLQSGLDEHRIKSIRVLGGGNEKNRDLFFDSIQFEKESVQPLSIEPLPDLLPLLTTNETILPIPENPVKVDWFIKDSNFQSTHDNDGLKTVFSYQPKSGTLDDFYVRTPAGERITPFVKGDIDFVNEQEGSGDRKLVRIEQNNNRVIYHWLFSSGKSQISYQIALQAKHNSLLIDVSVANSENISGMQLGYLQSSAKSKLVRIPMLTYGLPDPQVVCSGAVFVFALLDHYRSHASTLYARNEIISDTDVRFNGGCRYGKKTDGHRNSLVERIVLSVSPNFHDVLPNIPHAPSAMGHLTKSRVWRQHWGMPSDTTAHDKFYAPLKKLRDFGVSQFIVRHHEETWRDGSESFTMRLQAAPKKGGDAALIDYVKRVKELGFLCGLYTNYIDFAPVNANWSNDRVALQPDGNFVGAWPRCYTLKPSVAVTLEAEYAPRIREKFGSNTVYCDVHTAVRPWGRLDYDARVPEAGMFRAQHKAYSLLLVNEKKAYQGPVFSEGLYHWFYAGLTDGNYGQIRDSEPQSVAPLVDFDLLRIHPLEVDIGMGGPFMFYRSGTKPEDQNSRSNKFDRFLASTIAYGHNGYLLEAYWGITAQLKSYYMMQQLQTRYALRRVKKINYFNGREWVDSNEAVRSDCYTRGQVRALYENGTETIVNLSLTDTLTASLASKNVILPPNGYAASEKDMFELSGMKDGRRIDLVESPDYLYADGRGQKLKTKNITLTNSAVVLREKGSVWIIPIDETEQVTFRLAAMNLSKNVSVAGFDQDGNRLSVTIIYKTMNGMLTVTCDKNVFKYQILNR